MQPLQRSLRCVLRGLALVVAVVAVLALPGTAAAANATKASVNCTPKQSSPGFATTCVATVTDQGSAETRQPPWGTVTFTLEGTATGTFGPDASCELEPLGAFSSKCQVSYTPAAIAGGEHGVLATYEGSTAHGRATTRFSLSVTPVNDEPDNATRLSIPAKLTGTTEGATWDYEDPDLCGDAWGPVWYSLKPADTARLAVRLTVKGRIDSVVAVYRLDRSKLVSLGCALTDASGVAGVSFDSQAKASYLVAVAAPWDARWGGFLLETAKVPPVKPNGPLLRHDTQVTLDPLLRPSASYTVRMRQGVTYKVNAVATPGACMRIDVLRPGAHSAADVLGSSDACEAYLVVTPAAAGLASYPVIVTFADPAEPKKGDTSTLDVPARSWKPANVRLHVRTAQADDLAPGVLLRNASVRRGGLSASDADVVDVYRFRVTSTTDATLWARGAVPVDLLLLTPSGARVACACDGRFSATIVQRLGRGTFYAIVRGRPGATGRYSVSLRLRRPTTLGVRLAGGGKGRAVTATATVSPAVGGRFVFELQQLDPLSGWHFSRAVKRAVVAGKARLVIPPAQGRWRIRARYTGSLGASPSTSGWVQLPGW